MSNETTLDDVLALVAKATPGPWKFIPWHVVESDSEVHAADGHLICSTSSDATTEAITAAVNYLRAHGDELRAALEDARRYRWLRDHSHDDCATTRPAVWDTRPDGEVEDPGEGSRLDAAIDAAQEVVA